VVFVSPTKPKSSLSGVLTVLPKSDFTDGRVLIEELLNMEVRADNQKTSLFIYGDVRPDENPRSPSCRRERDCQTQ